MNKSRGKRKKIDQDELIPSILEPVEDPEFSGDESSKEYRRNWARLIQKIYELDPLTCPKCTSQMRVISVIEQPEIIKKILKSRLGRDGRLTRQKYGGLKPALHPRGPTRRRQRYT